MGAVASGPPGKTAQDGQALCHPPIVARGVWASVNKSDLEIWIFV